MITRLLASSVLKSTDIRHEVDAAKVGIAHIDVPTTVEDIKALGAFAHAKYRCRSPDIKRLSMSTFDRSSIAVKNLDRHDDGDYFV